VLALQQIQHLPVIPGGGNCIHSSHALLIKTSTFLAQLRTNLPPAAHLSIPLHQEAVPYQWIRTSSQNRNQKVGPAPSLELLSCAGLLPWRGGACCLAWPPRQRPALLNLHPLSSQEPYRERGKIPRNTEVIDESTSRTRYQWYLPQTEFAQQLQHGRP
jgi:hypothetical protein